MTCPACLKAQTNPHSGDTRKGCAGCDIRRLATMPKEMRQARYDAIEAEFGQDARREIVRCVREEYARIQNLKGLKCPT